MHDLGVWIFFLALFIYAVIGSFTARLASEFEQQMADVSRAIERVETKVASLEARLRKGTATAVAHTILRNEFQSCRGMIKRAPCVICIQQSTPKEVVGMFEEDVSLARPSLRTLRVRPGEYWPLRDTRRCRGSSDSLVIWSPESIASGDYALHAEPSE